MDKNCCKTHKIGVPYLQPKRYSYIPYLGTSYYVSVSSGFRGNAHHETREFRKLSPAVFLGGPANTTYSKKA